MIVLNEDALAMEPSIIDPALELPEDVISSAYSAGVLHFEEVVVPGRMTEAEARRLAVMA